MKRASRWIYVVPAAVLALGLSQAGPAGSAHARPEYAKKEGKECAFCHVNPKGGGPRTAKGNEYLANGKKFSAPGYGEDGKFTTEANGKTFGLVRKAIELTHWPDAIKRLTELKAKEKKGPGAQLVMNTLDQVDGRGRDLIRAAKDAITSGKAPEAAEALIRVEAEFKGRDPVKDVSKVRTDLEKLAGGKDAEVAAQKLEPMRLLWLDGQMKEAEGSPDAAVKLYQDLLTKSPDGPFTADAKKRLEELAKAPGAMPGMGG